MRSDPCRRKTANFYITSTKDISNVIIPLFEKFPLNGTKYLDYLAFKQSVSLNLDTSLSKETKVELISELRSSMNTPRNDFSMPSHHTIRITPYGLLGLIEGESTFCLNDSKNMRIHFEKLLELPILPEHVKDTRLELHSKVETAIIIKNNLYLEALKSNPSFKLNLNREGGQTGTYKDLVSHAWVSLGLTPFR